MNDQSYQWKGRHQYRFDLVPVPKPRMTQRDKWKKRPAVVQYRAFADELRLRAQNLRFTLPDAFQVVFHLPMPPSWSKSKRLEMFGKPHKAKPDGDNLVKALQDVLRAEGDSGIWDVWYRKYWSDRGLIAITVEEES